MGKMEPFLVHMEPEMKQELKRVSDETGISMAGLIRIAIRDHLKAWKQRMGFVKGVINP